MTCYEPEDVLVPVALAVTPGSKWASITTATVRRRLGVDGGTER